MANKPFNLNLEITVTDRIQCTCCGQPNIFGYLCDDCKAELNTLIGESTLTEEQKLYLVLGMRCKNQEFRNTGENE
jgi:hypothetical protein